MDEGSLSYKPKYRFDQLEGGTLLLIFIATCDWDNAIQVVKDSRYYLTQAFLAAPDPAPQIIQLFEVALATYNDILATLVKCKIGGPEELEETIDHLRAAVKVFKQPLEEHNNSRLVTRPTGRAVTIITGDTFQEYLSEIKKIRDKDIGNKRNSDINPSE